VKRNKEHEDTDILTGVSELRHERWHEMKLKKWLDEWSMTKLKMEVGVFGDGLERGQD